MWMQLPLAIESKLLLCLLDGPSIHPWRPLISYRPPPAAPPAPVAVAHPPTVVRCCCFQARGRARIRG